MPLESAYGVVVGTVLSADLVNPSGGKWPHYHIHVQAGSDVYDSAVNLKSLTEVKIEYRSRDLDTAVFANDLSLPVGWTTLGQNATSGALDYVRRLGLTGTAGWILQSGDNLITELQSLLTNVDRVFIFGAKYTTGLGVHDVHMNQGDPTGGDFALLDAIWQDGGLIFQYGFPTPRVTVLQIKFETQSLFTDDQGRPLSFHIPRPINYIPRWKWPPGDPMSESDRAALVENGLFEIIQWAGAIERVGGEARTALTRELHRQIGERLRGAETAHVEKVAAYVARMGVELG
jgi:hypothetical protein